MRGGSARSVFRGLRGSVVSGGPSPKDPGARGPKQMPMGWATRSSHKGRQPGSRHEERRSSGRSAGVRRGPNRQFVTLHTGRKS
eukprot:7037274-Heterocapsa_arctica.AAC.1